MKKPKHMFLYSALILTVIAVGGNWILQATAQDIPVDERIKQDTQLEERNLQRMNQKVIDAIHDRDVAWLLLTNGKLKVYTEYGENLSQEDLTEMQRLENVRSELLATINKWDTTVPDSDNLTKFAEAIAENEGTEEHHLSVRFNNPGAMRVPSTYTCDYDRVGNGGFMVFETREKGMECLKKGIMLYRDKGSSIATFSQAWAPHNDNNQPTVYAAKLAEKMGVHPDTPLNQLF